MSHLPPRRFSDTFAISFAPFLLNTVVALGLYAVSYVLLFGIESAAGLGMDEPAVSNAWLVTAWVAVSAGMHAIPSFGDTENVWREAKKNWRSSALALASLPFALLLYVANVLRFVWFDAIYSAALAYLVYVLFQLLAP